MLTILLQAILSQFSQKKKAKSSVDPVNHDNDGDFGASDEELDDDEGLVGDEDDGEFEADDDDEIDPSVQASDAMMVDEALVDLDYTDRVPSLTTSEAKLGRFSVAKVSLLTYSPGHEVY